MAQCCNTSTSGELIQIEMLHWAHAITLQRIKISQNYCTIARVYDPLPNLCLGSWRRDDGDGNGDDEGHGCEDDGEHEVVDLGDDVRPVVHLVTAARRGRVAELHPHARHARHQARHQPPPRALEATKPIKMP